MIAPEILEDCISVFKFVRDEGKGQNAAIEAACSTALTAHFGRMDQINKQDGVTPPALVVVANAIGVSLGELLMENKSTPFVRRRWLAMWLLRQPDMPWPAYSFPVIAKFMRFLDHTTVVHGVRKVDATPDLLAEARRLQSTLSVQAPKGERFSGLSQKREEQSGEGARYESKT